MQHYQKYKVTFFIAALITLTSCGGGGGSSNTSSNSTSIESTSLAEGYQALTAGSSENFNNSITLSSLIDRVFNSIKTHNWNLISTAYASGRCSATASKLLGAKSAKEWKELSLKDLDANTESNVDDSSSAECITGIQDSANYIALASDNLSNINGNKCEINLIRKSDSKVYCINTDIPSLLNVTGSQAYATYEIGVKQSSNNYGLDHQGDYAMNSGGYKSVVTRNGKFLFSPFTITINNNNYVGITRIKLTTKSKPQANVVWLKQQTVSNGIYSHYIRGFIGLETGDLIIDYIDNYDSTGHGRPITAATRYYAAIDSNESNPNNQLGLILWEGEHSSSNSAFDPAGELLSYLHSHNITQSVDTNNTPVTMYGLGSQPSINGVGSDPAATDRSVIVKLSPRQSRAGPFLDLFKVNLTVTNNQVTISSVDFLGQTNSYYPLAVVGSKIFMWNRASNYTDSGGVARSMIDGIISHPLSGGANAVDELIYAAGNTFTYNSYATKNSFFVLEGFGGYFGGNLVGNNKIYQIKSKGSNLTPYDIDIGRISNGLFTIKTISVNPLTDQLQVSGLKKSSISDYTDSTQWSAFISSEGVKQLRIYSNTNALSDDKPVLAIKDASGSTVSYTSSE